MNVKCYKIIVTFLLSIIILCPAGATGRLLRDNSNRITSLRHTLILQREFSKDSKDTVKHNHAWHSAEYFGEQRDYWWNRDFLDLMSNRYNFSKRRSILDVGCGVGHWGQLLARYFPSDSKLIGVDAEPNWILRAKERASITSSRYGIEFDYKVGDASALPFEDNVFDLVTCQTLLLHVSDPLKVVKEMFRVVKNNGIVVAVEPNNMANALIYNTANYDLPINTLKDMVYFQLVCERGKIALGLGNNSLGDVLPKHFDQSGFKNIQVYLSDKCSKLIPPYEGNEQQEIVKQELDWQNREIWIWNHEESRQYFMAGGGTEEEFIRLWGLALTLRKLSLSHIEKKQLYASGGTIMYLISGEKLLKEKM